ncbi:MAG: hypothetical protein K1X79_00185 [Oligoflexia bacterium]|nr:hypothetical protein [Oligoflexia bacterium]
MAQSSDDISFVEAFVGLLMEPQVTLEQLLNQERPPYALSMFNAILAILLGPPAIQLLRWDFLETRTRALAALFLMLVLTALFFILLEYLFLRLWSYRLSLLTLARLLVYAAAPLGVLALGYYIVNLSICQGRLTVASYLLTGVRDADDWLIAYFPALHIVGKMWFLYLFYHGLRILTNMRPALAVCLAIFSSIPFYLGMLSAFTFVDWLWPGSADIVAQLAMAIIK